MDTRHRRHLYLCCDWANEESLAAAFRNSRQNRQNTGTRFQSFTVPSECGHLGFWTFGSIKIVFVHVLFVWPVTLMKNMWGTSMRSKLRWEWKKKLFRTSPWVRKWRQSQFMIFLPEVIQKQKLIWYAECKKKSTLRWVLTLRLYF